MDQKLRFGTLAVHAGQDPTQWRCRAVVPPIFASTIYSLEDPSSQPVGDKRGELCFKTHNIK